MNPMAMMSQQMMNMMMSRFQGDPRFQQAQQMSQGKTEDQVKMICQNFCKSRGIDFDQAMSQFQSQMQGFQQMGLG